MKKWWDKHIQKNIKIIADGNVPTPVKLALQSEEGELSSSGALVIRTGKFTGRATEDKYVVRDSYSEDKIDWLSNINAMTHEQFTKIKKLFITDFNEYGRTIYATERSVGADPNFTLGLYLLTPSASHSLFAGHLFRPAVSAPELGHFIIFHCPDLEIDPEAYGLRSSTIISINFKTKEILISGTGYAGEIKKSVFSVMNTLLPDLDVLPMHAGANVDSHGKVSVFFGLSGTGKTTLSTDEGKILVGDDELGLSSGGIFNFEGGCYAKTFNLTEAGEPQVFHAVNRFGSVLENVMLDKDNNPVFSDKNLTENGRCSYPLNAIADASETGMAKFPSNIFFLSADAMGVLPAVAKLNPQQAMYYFLSGYTAKLAGTEMGLAGIKATFSHCFGAPFMMRKPTDYAQLLKKNLIEKKVNVWLINTGWYGGAYGVGKRYDLGTTRSIIRGIQQGLGETSGFEEEKTFGLMIPKDIPGVVRPMLNSRELWEDKSDYDKTATHLKDIFTTNFKKYTSPT